MDIVQDSRRDTDDEDRQIADRFVFRSTRNIHNDSGVKFNVGSVECHRSCATDDVIKLIRMGVIVQSGVLDFHMMHFTCGAILRFDQATDFTARFQPGSHFGRVAS